jgi:5-hydroxyisourate hydrolase
MSGITTHVLDISVGRPAAAIEVVLAAPDGDGGWRELARVETDGDGRARLAAGAEAGEYRITIEVADYLATGGHEVFYPRVEVHLALARAGEHHHVPLLLSPFGYSTYRGS